MRFEKWQALGNDYLIFEQSELRRACLQLSPPRIRRICDPHFGVGGDGLLLLQDGASEDVVAQLAIFNPDGSRAELSGNGSREAILYLRHRGWTDADEFTIETDAGPVSPRITGAQTCTVDIGRASLTSKDFPSGPADGAGELQADGRPWRFRHVSIGNPQCAIAVADLDRLAALDLPAIGPSIEGHELFPNRTNVSWYAPLPDGEQAAQGGSAGAAAGTLHSSRIRARIFERGVGETLSSGTGATGAAIAHLLEGGSGGGGGIVTVVLDGGELTGECADDLKVNLTGWARAVFAGSLSDQFIQELNETE
ncbi:MAG: diaminopimelate epimerase [Solirubrobacteraceae bacterium]